MTQGNCTSLIATDLDGSSTRWETITGTGANAAHREPWNKGKIVGQKAPFKVKDSARFAHVGSRVSFEVLAASFGLDADPRLQRIAHAVHFLDIGGIAVPEAAGLEAVLSGLREVHADDDQLNLAAATVFDALYAAPGQTT